MIMNGGPLSFTATSVTGPMYQADSMNEKRNFERDSIQKAIARD